MKRRTSTQCLLFVLKKRAEKFILIPSVVFKKDSELCQLFTRSNIKILNSNEEFPALKEALQRNLVEVLQLIVICGYFESKDWKWYKATSDAPPYNLISVETGNVEFVRQLFGKNAAVYGESHIDYFAEVQQIDDGAAGIIERLLKFQADVEYKNLSGGTLLHLAVRYTNIFLVKSLVNLKTKIDALDVDGSTALHYAIKENKVDKYSRQNKSTHETVRLAIVKLLLQGGAAVNAAEEDGSTTLLLAAGKGYSYIVSVLLKNGSEVNIGNNDGWTPLHAAAKIGKLEVVAELLDRGAMVNAEVTYRYAKGVTPLCVAVEEGHIEVVKYLLERGANPNIQCYDGQTSLSLAVNYEKVDIVQCILKHHPDLKKKTAKLVNCKTVFRDKEAHEKIKKLLSKQRFTLIAEGTDLNYAIRRKDFETTKTLLQSGANMHKISLVYNEYDHKFRKTMPLLTAVEIKENNFVKLLINHGADVHARLNLDKPEDLKLLQGKTPLYETAYYQNVDAAMMLFAENATFSRDLEDKFVEDALELEDPKFLEEVLRKGLKIHGSVAELDSYLITASMLANLKLMNVLVELGASMEARDEFGMTAFHYACDCSPDIPSSDLMMFFDLGVIKCLIQNNADIEALDYHRNTPIIPAIKNDRHGIVIQLLKYGASVDITDYSGITAFHHAVYGNQMQIFKAILQFHFVDTMFIVKNNIYQLFNLSYIEGLRSSKAHQSLDFLEGNDTSRIIKNLEKFFVILAKHMIKLRVFFPHKEEIFDFCSETNLQSLSSSTFTVRPSKFKEDFWLDFQEQCKAEVANMKRRSIGAAKASYYDILTKNVEKLLCYLQNPVIFKTLKSKSYKNEFPLYSKILSYQFEKGCFRRTLLNQALKKCHLLASVFKSLPLNLKEMVLSYLNNRDLEVALHACACITNRQ